MPIFGELTIKTDKGRVWGGGYAGARVEAGDVPSSLQPALLPFLFQLSSFLGFLYSCIMMS